ncbi:MAG: hypothetical protein ACJAYE_002090 [Candidatus Azotimanducaceae bacterium]|jgi:hypothetical protein
MKNFKSTLSTLLVMVTLTVSSARADVITATYSGVLKPDALSFLAA